MGDQLWVAFAAALAGGVGAVLRYALDVAITARLARRVGGAKFPWGIWVVNLSGALAIGVLIGATGAGHPMAQVLGAGVLGGYTTFSSASFDTVQLFRRGRILAAVANGLGQLLAAGAFAMAGLWLGAFVAM